MFLTETWSGSALCTAVNLDDGSDLPEGQPTPTVLVLEDREPPGA